MNMNIIGEWLAYIRMRRVIRFLQSPRGCEWDRAQTPLSLRAHLREETEELITEIDSETRSTGNIIEEAGDVLLVLNLLVHSFRDEKMINFKNIYRALAKKLIFRHPHIFKRKIKKATPRQTAAHKHYWQKMKARENEMKREREQRVT